MIDPFLKWAGGKRWLVRRFDTLFPKVFTRYIEPFLGSGSVFFHLNPGKAILADNNSELINAYRCVKATPLLIHRRLIQYQARHSAAFYYKIRKAAPPAALDRAVRFIYLNRTCFNGLYRVNLDGLFNVPVGSKTKVQFPTRYLSDIAMAMKHASIRVADFETSLAEAGAGDFAYIDPPYTVMHNNNNFIKYNASLFSWKDQIRLSVAVRRAARRGALIMVSNADHESVRELYGGFGTHHSVERSSRLAADAQHRERATELVVVNY